MLDLLLCDTRCDSVSSGESDRYNSNASLNGIDGCKKCEALDWYIGLCERTVTSLQEVNIKLKNQIQENPKSNCELSTNVKPQASIVLQNDDKMNSGPVHTTPHIPTSNLTDIPPTEDGKPSVMVISSSMGRGVAGQIRRLSGFSWYGSVDPSATAESLTGLLDGIFSDDKPDIVCVMAGTNNVDNQDRPKVIVDKMENLVLKTKEKCPEAKIILSGILHRTDKPHLNKTIDVVNHVLEKKSTVNGYTFVDHNLVRNGTMDQLVKKDGLHLNTTGVKSVAKNIVDAVKSVNLIFHQGHRNIQNPPQEHLIQDYSMTSQINVVTGMRPVHHVNNTNPWW